MTEYIVSFLGFYKSRFVAKIMLGSTGKKNIIDLKLLKKQAYIPIEFEVKGSKFIRKNQSQTGGRLFNKILYLITLLFVILILYLSISYIRGLTDYQGAWEVQLTENDKNSGIKKIVYQIQDSQIVQTTESQSDSLKVKTQIVYEVSLSDKRSFEIYFKIKDIKINLIDIVFFNQLCIDYAGNCDLIKQRYEDAFKQSLDKQKRNLINTNLRLQISPDNYKISFIDRQESLIRKN